MTTYDIIGVTRLVPDRVGLIAGHHSLAETRELLAVADYRFNEVEQALGESRSKNAPPLVRAELDADWARLFSSWVSARRDILRDLTIKAAAFPFVSANAIPTEDEWKETLAFTQGQELVKGSLQDVTRRTEQILGRPILFENQPSQNAPDLDLEIFKELDAQIRAGEAAAQKAKDSATVKTVLTVGGTVLAVGLAAAFLPEIAMAFAALGRRRKK